MPCQLLGSWGHSKDDIPEINTITIQKLKPRTVHLNSKADWVGMKREMLDFQSQFLATCSGKMQKHYGRNSRLSSKVLRGKKNLPWVTQILKRMMNKWDCLYQVQKRTGNENDRSQFKKANYEVDCKVKTAYNSYLGSLVGTSDDEENDTRPDSKKLFSYLKNGAPRALHL